MNKEFITYKEALELKELGFNEACIATYSNYTRKDYYNSTGISNWEFLKLKEPKLNLDTDSNINSELSKLLDYDSNAYISAPLYQQAFRWFREKDIYFEIVTIKVNKEYELSLPNDLKTGFKTYEEAELECLRELIKIVKQKNNG